MKPFPIAKIALFAAGILALLAACSPVAGDPLKGTSWSLLEMNGRSALEGTTVTASFADGNVSGSGGCNSYGGAYKVNGDKLQIKELVSTLMACADTGVMDQEAAFLSALGNAQSFKLTGGQLQVVTADGQELTFAAGVPK